ncbi:MAG: hypothetical protein WA208_02680 [Thermoanaerobaculia bacterium]
MSHLTAAQIAAHLAGTDPAASEHVLECDECAGAVAATELMAHATFGPGEVPTDGPRHSATIEDALQQMTSPAVGTVKALLRAEAVACEQDPRRALELSNRAIAVGQTMTGDPTMVQLLRARIWRERAGTYRALGEYDDGLAALDVAERELDGVLVRAFEDAQIAYTRATILWKTRSDDQRARALARAAGEVFLQHGDRLRSIHAQILLGGMDFVEGRYDTARATFSAALPDAVALGDAATIAYLHENIAACAQELDDLPVAAIHYASAVALFAHLEMKVEEFRAEWNRGLLSLQMGHVIDGRTRLQRAANGFLSHGNASDAALVTIDLAEHLAQAGDQARALEELRRISRSGVPAYVRVQLDVLTGAMRRGNAEPAFRDVRIALLAPAP